MFSPPVTQCDYATTEMYFKLKQCRKEWYNYKNEQRRVHPNSKR